MLINILKFSKKGEFFYYDNKEFKNSVFRDYLKEVLNFKFESFLTSKGMLEIYVGKKRLVINTNYFFEGHNSVLEMLGLLDVEIDAIIDWKNK